MDTTKIDQRHEEYFPLFFRIVIESLVENLDANGSQMQTNLLWPANFETCQTDFERVCVLLNFTAVRTFKFQEKSLSVQTHEPSLCESSSVTLREFGNSSWRDGKIRHALIAYNKALMLAMNNEQKAFAYANRSLVLASLGMYTSALKDIDRALQHNYPVDRRLRLLARRAQYLLHLDRVREAHEGFLSVQKELDSSAKLRDTLSRQVQDGLRQCANFLANKVAGVKKLDPTMSPLKISYTDVSSLKSVVPGKKGKKKKNNSVHFPSFELTYGGDDVGWQLVATKDISPGDLITVDKPYARRLHLSCASSHCYRCFRRTIDPVPCRRCAYAVFCSETCEEASWSPVWLESPSNSDCETLRNNPCHRFDCGQVPRLFMDDYAGWKFLRGQHTPLVNSESIKKYQDQLSSLSLDECIGGPKVASLAFTCVARTAPSIIRSLVTRSVANIGKSGSPLLAFTGRRHLPDGDLTADNYAAVTWLVTNAEKRPLSDLWQRTVAAVYLAHCLSAGGYPLDWNENCLLDPSRSKELSPDSALPASWAAACLLHQLQCVASNAHTFSVSRYIQREPKSDKDPSVATRGINLTEIQDVELGSCLYPVLSLLNHSCDPNVTLIFMRDGACGVFALRPIPKGSPLYGNYGVHYAIHSLTERHHLLSTQYHFQCTCPACLENWSQLKYETIRLICQHCHRKFVFDNLTNTIGCGQSSDGCQCSFSIRCRTIHRFTQLVHKDLKDKMTSIPAQYNSLCFHEIKPNILDKHITFLSNMLNSKNLGGLLLRPAVPFDWTQELLKTLLSLRYGCWYVENEKIHLPTDEV